MAQERTPMSLVPEFPFILQSVAPGAARREPAPPPPPPGCPLSTYNFDNSDCVTIVSPNSRLAIVGGVLQVTGLNGTYTDRATSTNSVGANQNYQVDIDFLNPTYDTGGNDPLESTAHIGWSFSDGAYEGGQNEGFWIQPGNFAPAPPHLRFIADAPGVFAEWVRDIPLTNLYFRMKRTGLLLTLEMYSDAARTILINSTNFTMTAATAWPNFHFIGGLTPTFGGGSKSLNVDIDNAAFT